MVNRHLTKQLSQIKETLDSAKPPAKTRADINKSNLKEVVEFAGGLNQMALAVLGGTIALLLSTSYLRPAGLHMRYTYFLFIPGWICLGASVYFGMVIRQQYLAYLLTEGSQIPGAVNTSAIQIGRAHV